MKKKALIVIDIQNIYFTEGPYLLWEPKRAAQNARTVIDAFRRQGLPVIHVKHHFNTSTYDMDSDYLNNFYSLTAPLPEEKVVEKDFPNAFLKTQLQEYLQKIGVEELVIVGMMSHMCIDTTVRACQDYGYSVTVVEDACTTKTLRFQGVDIPAELAHTAFMAALNGMFADVISTEEAVNCKKV